MKLTLVQSPAMMAVDSYSTITQPPLGVAYLAAYARRLGHEVHVADGVGAAVKSIRHERLLAEAGDQGGPRDS